MPVDPSSGAVRKSQTRNRRSDLAEVSSTVAQDARGLYQNILAAYEAAAEAARVGKDGADPATRTTFLNVELARAIAGASTEWIQELSGSLKLGPKEELDFRRAVATLKVLLTEAQDTVDGRAQIEGLKPAQIEQLRRRLFDLTDRFGAWQFFQGWKQLGAGEAFQALQDGKPVTLRHSSTSTFEITPAKEHRTFWRRELLWREPAVTSDLTETDHEVQLSSLRDFAAWSGIPL